MRGSYSTRENELSQRSSGPKDGKVCSVTFVPIEYKTWIVSEDGHASFRSHDVVLRSGSNLFCSVWYKHMKYYEMFDLWKIVLSMNSENIALLNFVIFVIAHIIEYLANHCM